jgi:glyoxylase-like metal-dependent hydrolase (beta-lactamase superfamily II)
MVEGAIMIPLRWRLLYGGVCTHPEKVVLPNRKWKNRIFPALFALIEHPVHGLILFDTGYAKRFFDETNPFPYRFYRMITPVIISESDSALAQIEKLGYQASEIRYIILSHLHADHICGCLDFPSSTFVCSQKAYQSVVGKTGLEAVKQGFIPNLLPSDFADRVQFIEETKRVKVVSPFQEGYDLFGDGSILAVDLPGHAAGQIGVFFQTEQDEQIFLAADSCWLEEQYRKNSMPHPLAGLITDDQDAYRESLNKVHQLSIEHPEIKIIPSHCLDTWQRWKGKW